MTKRRERPTMIDKILHIKVNIQKHKPRVDSVVHFPLNGLIDFLIYGVLAPFSAIFQLYHGDQI